MTTDKYQRETAPDFQAFDEVSIVTVPRFKTSGLSGDEWRFSAQVQFKKKGFVVAERGFSNVKYAVEYLTMMQVQWAEMGEGEVKDVRKKIEAEGFCDQEGCTEKATNTFLIKQFTCKQCGQKETHDWKQNRVWMFCDKHKRRGDSDLVDNDNNLISLTT